MAWVGYIFSGNKWEPLKNSPNSLLWSKRSVINNYSCILGKPVIDGPELILFKAGEDAVAYINIKIEIPEEIKISLKAQQSSIRLPIVNNHATNNRR